MAQHRRATSFGQHSAVHLPKTLSVTHIQRSPPLTGAKFQTFIPFDKT